MKLVSRVNISDFRLKLLLKQSHMVGFVYIISVDRSAHKVTFNTVLMFEIHAK